MVLNLTGDSQPQHRQQGKPVIQTPLLARHMCEISVHCVYIRVIVDGLDESN